MKIVKLNISDLEGNIGQIPGLPKNPRKWSEDEVSVLAASLLETPELFEARPIICVPYGEKYVILGGNMRFEASKKNQAKTVPCVVMPKNTTIEKMIEIAAKDNGSIILGPSYTFGLNNGFVSLSAFYRLDTKETVSSPQLSNAYLLAYKWLEFNGFNHLWYSNGFCFFGEERIHFNITQKFKVGFICDITHFGEWRIIPQAGIRFDI